MTCTGYLLDLGAPQHLRARIHCPGCAEAEKLRAELEAARAELEAERAVTEGIREDIAAFLLDRADQYDTDRWEWHPLADAAKAIMGGDFDAAVDHGELQETELRSRVRNWGNK